VSGSRIDTIGFGESRPRATNSNPSGRQLNRRVEIHMRANQA
jgi:OOP family OmpA-OmpF porin